MDEFTENILQAIETIANDTVSKLQYDKTVKAKIYSIVNLDTGEYKVRYDGNIFSAYNDDSSKRYKVDDWVYVMIPEGDFSNRKLITSPVTAQSLSEGQLNQLQNTVIAVSPSLLDMYDGEVEPPYQGVIAGVEPGQDGSEFYIYKGSEEYDPNDYHGLFQQYGAQYENIRISGSFSTKFHCVHNKGNYGLEIGFYTRDGGTVSYRLDLNSFLGDPYSLTVYSPQSVVVKVPKSFLLGLSYIKLFEENFIPDHFIENGVVTDKENLTNSNIFVKDVSIDFVEVRDMADTTYYLTISALQGIAFSPTVSTIDLVGRLIYQGSNIMDDKTCQCSWFQRNVDITIGEDRYDKNAGIGWSPLYNMTSQLELTSEDVAHQQDYKLLVTYNNNVQLSAEITLYNHLSPYSFELEQVTNDADISLRISDQNLVGKWYLSYPDGSYMKISGDEMVNSIVVNQYLQYSSVQFYCAVYAEDKYLGTLIHTISNSESENDLSIQYIGEDSFRYDANGDIAIEDSEKERTLQVALTWREGVGTSYSVRWTAKDNENREIQIPGDKNESYNPDNSMMQGLWVDNYNVLHYNIKQKYKINYNNNTLTVKIETISGDTYRFDKEILFLKDGDQGTNGTTYITAIRPCDSDGNKLSGLNPLTYQDGECTNILPVRCYVYKDGELINNDDSYGLQYQWTGVNVIVDGEGSQVNLTSEQEITEESTSKDLQFYVKVQVTITDKQNKQVDIYASYPIDIAINEIDYSKIDIDDIPSYIKYTASGQTPQFYGNSLNYFYDGQAYNDLIESLNTNLLTVSTDRVGEKYLEAASEFIFSEDTESNIGILSLRDPTSEERRLIHPIIMYLDTYGNEAINGWDGTAVVVNEEEDHYVFAPQVGAGEKDEANRFTGVIMGADSTQQKEGYRKSKIGLYGYQKGINTFGLMEDGTAFFGAKSGGGQIVINGNTATISGGNGGDNTSGMTITLADLDEDSRTEAIKLGGGVFSVNYGGEVNASNATVEGRLYATEGKIGGGQRASAGWVITENRLTSGSGAKTVALDSSDEWYAIWAGRSSAGDSYDSSKTSDKITSPAPFVVTQDGFLYASNAEIKGRIVAGSGSIGGWLIGSNTLESMRGSTQGVVGMASSGQAAFWVGEGITSNTGSISSSVDRTNSAYFLVTRDGKLYCKAAEVKGRITADSGSIGGWTISSNSIKGGNTYLYSDGRISTPNFSVSSSGILSASDASINGSITATYLSCDNGYIGGWSIGSNYLSGGNTTLNSSTGITTNGLKFNLSGKGGSASGGIQYVKGSNGEVVQIYSDNQLELDARYGDINIEAGDGHELFLCGHNGTRLGGWSYQDAPVSIMGDIRINGTDIDAYIANHSGGVTSSEVQRMINNSLSGYATQSWCESNFASKSSS